MGWGVINSNHVVHFSDLLRDCLLESSTTGNPYTWQKRLQSTSALLTRFDRGVAIVNLVMSFLEGGVEVLHQKNSNHNPLFLHCSSKGR